MQLSFEDKGHKYTTRSFQYMRTTCLSPTAKLASFLFKGRRLSQASLELSSSRGVFGSRESERKKRERRERREKIKAKLKNKTLFTKAVKMKTYKSPKKLVFTLIHLFSLLQNMRGIYKPPQGMKLPKTLITRLSYRTFR